MADDVRFRFVETVKTKLFAPEKRRLQKMIDHLVERNAETLIGVVGHFGFMFDGQNYLKSNAQYAKGRFPTLRFDLNDEMYSVLEDRKQVELDKAQIGQILSKLQYHAQNMQERRDALPECIVNLFPELRAIERRSQPSFFMDGSDTFQEWERMMPKIESYAIASLIY